MAERITYIAHDHSYIAPRSATAIAERQAAFDRVATTKDALKPARRRILKAIFKALEYRFEQNFGFTGREYINRQDIAAALGNQKLRPYDIEQVRMFVAWGLLIEDSRNLVRYRQRDDGSKLQVGAGYELIYRVNSDTLYCWLALGEPSRSQLEQLSSAERERQRQAEAERQAAERQAETKRQADIEREKRKQQQKIERQAERERQAAAQAQALQESLRRNRSLVDKALEWVGSRLG